MQVRKRSGAMEPVSFDKILNAVKRNATGLLRVQPDVVALRAINGMYDGIATRELDEMCARACADMVLQEPEYAVLGGRILIDIACEDVRGQGITGIRSSIDHGIKQELVASNMPPSEGFDEFFLTKIRPQWDAFFEVVDAAQEPDLEVFGAATVIERYLLKDRVTRLPIETPKQWLARVAMGVANTVEEAMRYWGIMHSLKALPSTPTLFNSGTPRPQMSSCFLHDSPHDSLEGIYKAITDIARLSKYAGGIAGSWSGIRSLGSPIKGTNGESNGIIPWLRIEDASVAAVNQGGKRLGAVAVDLETWHADIEDFLDLHNQEGDINRRTRNLNLTNWIPDLFMERVKSDSDWTLFDPAVCPEFKDLCGDAFRSVYETLEQQGKGKKTIKARVLFEKMMRTLAETGNGWMCWKDRSNALCNQTGDGDVVHSTNLCTEILEVTKTDKWVAVCNLLSMNLAKYVRRTSARLKQPEGWTPVAVSSSAFDAVGFGRDVEFCVRMLDSVIDKNFYTIPEARESNLAWRPVGLGLMGLTEAFHILGCVYGDDESRELNRSVFELMAFHSLRASCDLAREKGACPMWKSTLMAKDGLFHHERWRRETSGSKEILLTVPESAWEELRADIAKYGLRNSLLMAVAPTATIALIAGTSECTEEMQQLALRRETMGGDFIQVNKHMVRELQKLGLWTDEFITRFKLNEGSIKGLEGVPLEVQDRFKTAFEISQRLVIDMAVDRAPFIDQSQSLNLFMREPTIDKLSSMYMHAWQQGLKTTYYLRRRPPTEIAQTAQGTPSPEKVSAEGAACPIDGSCESCQ